MKYLFSFLVIIISIQYLLLTVVNCGVVKSTNKFTNEKRMHPPSINAAAKNDGSQNNIKFLNRNNENDGTFWLNNAKEFVQKQLEMELNKNIAKNVILFLGDGLSMPTLAATRAYLGGEEQSLSFEQFPSISMAKTYCLDYQVPDSACTATAYLCGVKGNYETIGVNGKVTAHNCESILDKSKHTESIAKWSMDAGKVAGIVTNTRITHASPAGVYAHTAHRDWDTDVNIRNDGCDPNQIDDIAEQLIYGDGKNLRVILGGGRRAFFNESEIDAQGNRGYRNDGRNLITEWLANVNDEMERRKYVEDRASLLNIDIADTDYILGLFASSHLLYNLENLNYNAENEREPNLTEMTEIAIDLLKKHDEGFFLFVEGGQIDFGHHGTFARMSIDETAEFSKAIAAAVAKVNLNETLIIVTSDHSHTLTMAGYPNRGDDIFGIAGISNMDNLPYMTLSYSNGLGFDKYFNEVTAARVNISEIDITPFNVPFPTMIDQDPETHAGDDVAVFAIGPWSHLFAGVYEQSFIPHIAAYAACIGNGLKACD